jgi:hypothetical protein
LIKPSSSECPLAITVGIINATSLRLDRRPPQPTGPLLRPGYVVPAIIATTTRSANLDDSRRLPRVSGYTAGLCPTTWSGLSPRPSLICHNTPSIRATTPTPGGDVRAYIRFFLTPRAFPRVTMGRLLHHPDTRFCRGELSTLQCSLDATARMVASLPVRVRPHAKRRPTKTCTPELSPEAITRLQSRV